MQDIDLPESVEELLEKVRAYMPEVDTSRLMQAYAFAEEKHRGQKRESGEPYISHPLAVAHILADLQMDLDSIVAGILHDVIEDTGITQEELKRRFGETVATLVEGVSKLTLPEERSSPTSSEPARKRAAIHKAAENLRKMLLAVSKDLRVMIIKLADRLHNMQTLDALPPEKRERIATETLQIYAPLAHRLGIWQIKWRLDDLAFRYLHPEEYEQISTRVARTREEREQEIHELVRTLKERLQKEGIQAEVYGRPKHLYSIYQKMLRQEIDFDQIYDLMALRVIVNTELECYQALGLVHDLWMPIPGFFYDYIAKPKPNGYRSLHTKVNSPSGQPLEVQIRTHQMHRLAEYGIAAHWQYKEGGTDDPNYREKLARLRQQCLDWTDARSSGEFLSNLLGDLFADQVFVFTPRGDVIDLPVGSTPVDFAYRIHTELGHRCVGAKVHGRIVPLHYQLRNGDMVEVITRPHAQPSLDWLGFVKSSTARSKIRAYFRKVRRVEYIARGRGMIEREAERAKIGKELLSERLEQIAKLLHFATVEDLFASVGEGLTSVQPCIQKLRTLEPSAPAEQEYASRKPSTLTVTAEGIEDMMMRRARCCYPLPGDDLLGYITRGRGLVLHRQSCGNIRTYQQKEPERIVPVDWKPVGKASYPVLIRIETTDRVGLLSDITTILGDAQCNIASARIQTFPSHTALIEMMIEVPNVQHLREVFRRISNLSEILAVYRVEPRAKEEK